MSKFSFLCLKGKEATVLDIRYKPPSYLLSQRADLLVARLRRCTLCLPSAGLEIFSHLFIEHQLCQAPGVTSSRGIKWWVRQESSSLSSSVHSVVNWRNSLPQKDSIRAKQREACLGRGESKSGTL